MELRRFKLIKSLCGVHRVKCTPSILHVIKNKQLIVFYCEAWILYITVPWTFFHQKTVDGASIRYSIKWQSISCQYCTFIHEWIDGWSYPVQGCKDAGDYPCWHRTRGRIHPGQITSPSKYFTVIYNGNVLLCTCVLLLTNIVLSGCIIKVCKKIIKKNLKMNRKELQRK